MPPRGLQKAEAEEVEALVAAVASTPKGTKKSTDAATMPKAYHPKIVEAAWCARLWSQLS